MTRLYIFDMDGTLLPGTTGMLQIAKVLEQIDLLRELERAYYEKKLSNVGFAKSIFEMWNAISADTVREAFETAPKLENIETVLNKIAASGAISCLITSAPDFFANHFKSYGFHYIYASQPFTLQSQRFTPELLVHAEDKPRVARDLCKTLGLSFDNAVAFGDSHSDALLFQELTHTVSVNGDHYIKEIARHHYVGSDLLEAFSLVEASV